MAMPPPPPGYQQPGYPAPGGPGSPRPGMVTAAAVLAFVVGGLGIISGLISFGVLSTVGGAFVLLIILNLVVAAALIWGGVQAIGGKDGRILVAISGISILINLITMLIYFSPSYLLGMVIPILILVFMLNDQSKTWIRSQGGKTF